MSQSVHKLSMMTNSLIRSYSKRVSEYLGTVNSKQNRQQCSSPGFSLVQCYNNSSQF